METTINVKDTEGLLHHLILPFQTDDGTMFYCDLHVWNRIYVQWQGKEVKAELLSVIEWCNLSVHGNAFFILDGKKIHKAVFTPPNIEITYFRDFQEYERLIGDGFLSRTIDANKYVYRICDDPDKDKILVDASDDQIINMHPKFIHRQKAFYHSYTTRSRVPQLLKLTDNIFVVEAAYLHLYSREDYQYIYCSTGSDCLYVLDTETLKFLYPIRIKGCKYINNIAGVHNGTISVSGHIGGREYLVTAQLPSGYFAEGFHASGEFRFEKVHSIVKEEDHEFRSKFLNEFSITKVIGIGGFGIVFEAINNMDKVIYAVKRISVNANEMTRALREVDVLSRLNHPGIVSYTSSWTENPPKGWQIESDIPILRENGSLNELSNIRYNDIFIYMQMEKCDQSMAQWITNNQQLSSRSTSQIHSWSKQILSAVAYIHEKDLIHRDLKPQNILIANSGLLKLCDLGIVTNRRVPEADGTELTRTSIGTGLYMSPEQGSLHSRYGSKTDVFSIGLILAELSIAMPPTERTKIFDDYRRGKKCEIIANLETAEVIEMLTRVDPKNRPTCKEMLAHQYFNL